MKPRTGHIFKRGEIYWLQYRVDGKKFQQSLGTGSAREAKTEADHIMAPFKAGGEAELLAAVAARIKSARNIAATGGKAVPLDGAWTEFLALDKERRPYPGPATLAQYEGHWGAFVDWMEKNAPSVKTMAAVKADHAVRFIRQLNADRLSDGRVNKYKRFMKMFFRVMAQVGGGTENPFAVIQTNKLVVQTAKQPFTVEELREIVSAATGEMQTLYLSGAGTGMRMGDCCTLMWNECDIIRRLILRLPRKTARNGKVVKIGIPAWLADHLATLPRRGPYVMPGLAAEYLAGNAPAITRRIQAHLEKCKIQTVKPGTGGDTGKRAVVLKGFHSFRHSYVSLNADAGTPQATMQKLVGHGSPMMTLHYLTPTDSMVLKAADSLPHLLPGDTTEPTREPLPKWAVAIVENATSLKALRAELLKG